MPDDRGKLTREEPERNKTPTSITDEDRQAQLEVDLEAVRAAMGRVRAEPITGGLRPSNRCPNCGHEFH